eukprot:530956-Alexandrium_andersonii.AAC.1
MRPKARPQWRPRPMLKGCGSSPARRTSPSCSPSSSRTLCRRRQSRMRMDHCRPRGARGAGS